MKNATSMPASRQRARADGDARFLSGDVEAAFGRQLGAALGDKRRLMGFKLDGERNNRRARGPARG